MQDRREKLELIKLQGTTIRIGRTPKSGPVFFLARYDHSRETFTTRNVHNGTESRLTVEELSKALADGLAHVSKVPGVIYHA